MGWLKNFTIINTTERAVNALLKKMNMIIETYPDPNKVDLKRVLEKIIVLRGSLPEDLSWDEALVLYIIQAVTKELSYDLSTDQGKVILLINNTAYKTLQRMNYVSPDRSVEVYRHFILTYREQQERLKDPDSFTLKERQEWEQLLKEERVTLFQKMKEERRGGKCIEGDCKNGQGTMGYSDGRKYVGEFKGGRIYGQGTLTFPDGDKYVGKFKNGKFHGQGALSYSDGRRYVGEFKDGKVHGQGALSYSDGRRYVGEFKDGKVIRR